MRVMLRVAYDGTNYCGWQIQPEAITIEGVINKELSQLLGEEIHIIGASRTDSGVHALDNVAVFDTETRIPPEKMCLALNARLPEDIVVQSSMQVPDDFHPRKCVNAKTYEYKILCREKPLPLYRFNTHFVRKCPDVELMRQAAQFIVGEHDFKGFCSIKTQAETTVRNVHGIEVVDEQLREGGNLITIRVTGGGFLYNMVRIIAGTLIEAGFGKRDAKTIQQAVETGERTLAGPTAPAKGLTLAKIEFEEECLIPDIREC